ncbi:ferritin-like domain-containing protein [Streptomyces sirii]|uniref:ferritin-like domain-containing protein n=1 Tax=Streptomyces sirii TaxID=3127701 RepID=UPI003D35DEFA
MITAMALDAQGFGIPQTIEELRTYLQGALEVEHLTIPVYMTGMYSIHPGANRTAYFAIRSVLMEEMLHMTLVANLLNAVGGKPVVGRKEFVAKYPAKLPFSSDKDVPLIHLRHFSPDALRTFLRIELPRKLAPHPKPGEGWTSIGQFYDAIRQGLEKLVEDHGEAAVFPQRPARQVGPEDFYNSGGEVFAVHDLKSAKLAIRVISEQGEGLDDHIWTSDDLIFGEQRQLAHYFRFNEIYTGRSYGPHDTPKDPPSGPCWTSPGTTPTRSTVTPRSPTTRRTRRCTSRPSPSTPATPPCSPTSSRPSTAPPGDGPGHPHHAGTPRPLRTALPQPAPRAAGPLRQPHLRTREAAVRRRLRNGRGEPAARRPGSRRADRSLRRPELGGGAPYRRIGRDETPCRTPEQRTAGCGARISGRGP